MIKSSATLVLCCLAVMEDLVMLCVSTLLHVEGYFVYQSYHLLKYTALCCFHVSFLICVCECMSMSLGVCVSVHMGAVALAPPCVGVCGVCMCMCMFVCVCVCVC